MCLAFHQAVRIVDGSRHQDVGLVGCVAEHQALVASALLLVLGLINAHGDIRRLFADGIQDGAGSAVEAQVGAVVADVEDDVTDHVLEVNVSGRGDLAGDDGHAGLDHGLHSYPGVRVVRENGVEDGVRYLVCHLVRVSFRYGFRCKDGIFAHVFFPVCSLRWPNRRTCI